MFLQVSVCPQGGGGVVSQHALRQTPPHPDQTPPTRHPLDQLPPPRPDPPGIRYTPPLWNQVHPPWTRHLLDQTTPLTRHPLDQTPPQTRPPWDQVHPPGLSTPPGTMYTPPGLSTPPRADTPPPDQTPTPLQSRACCEIRSTCGRYTSYWNSILLASIFLGYLPPW